MVRDGILAQLLEPSNLAQLWQRFLSLQQGSMSRSVFRRINEHDHNVVAIALHNFCAG